MIASGRAFQFAILLVLGAAMFVYMYRAKRGHIPYIRKIAVIDRINEAIGRATEMGRPVHFGTGVGSQLSGVNAPMTLAGVSVLCYVAGLCAQYATGFISTFNVPELIPFVQDVVEETYNARGRPGAYNQNEMVRYLSDVLMSYALAATGIVTREKVAANFYIGAIMGEAPIILEEAHNAGAITIAGTARWGTMPMVAVLSDYCIIMEEIYAAAAYVSKDPQTISTLAAEDVGKYLSIVLVLLGVVLTSFGVEIIQQMISR